MNKHKAEDVKEKKAVLKEEPIKAKEVVVDPSGNRVSVIMANIHRGIGLESFTNLTKDEEKALFMALEKESQSEMTFKDMARENRRTAIRKQLGK